MHQVSRNRAPVRVIVNPAAAGGRGRKAAGLLLAELERRGVRCDAEWTRAPGHAVELAARAARDGVGRVVAVGGDGTVHEVAQGLLRDRLREASGGDAAGAASAGPGGAASPAREGVDGPVAGAESAKSAESASAVPALVLLPVGTGNDFHRMIGGPRTPDTAADLIEGGVVRRFDVGRVRWEEGERCFVNLLGVGIDVDILRLRTRFARLPGLLQYLAALLNAMAAYRPIAVEIATPERRIVARTTISVVTVGPSIGGGFMINPDARAVGRVAGPVSRGRDESAPASGSRPQGHSGLPPELAPHHLGQDPAGRDPPPGRRALLLRGGRRACAERRPRAARGPAGRSAPGGDARSWVGGRQGCWPWRPGVGTRQRAGG